jgi:hypothetical protein
MAPLDDWEEENGMAGSMHITASRLQPALWVERED